jgi:hypothetical protein
MKEVTVKRGPEGDLEVRHMPLALVYALRELPKLLSPEFPEATSRLSQDPYAGHPGEGAEDPSGDWSRHTRSSAISSSQPGRSCSRISRA